MKKTSLACSVAMLAASVASSFGAGSVVSTGTGVPPAQLGPYTLTPLVAGHDDPRTGWVTDVPSPLGGAVLFSEALEILEVGTGWAAWSHGFTGDVYALDPSAAGPFSLTLTLPPETGAFLFYAEPGPFLLLGVTATLNDGTSLTQDIDGDGGAAGFGLWAPLGGALLSVTVTSDFDFALAEFAIARSAVPEAGTWLAGGMAIGLVGFSVYRRRRA